MGYQVVLEWYVNHPSYERLNLDEGVMPPEDAVVLEYQVLDVEVDSNGNLGVHTLKPMSGTIPILKRDHVFSGLNTNKYYLWVRKLVIFKDNEPIQSFDYSITGLKHFSHGQEGQGWEYRANDIEFPYSKEEALVHLKDGELRESLGLLLASHGVSTAVSSYALGELNNLKSKYGGIILDARWTHRVDSELLDVIGLEARMNPIHTTSRDSDWFGLNITLSPEYLSGYQGEPSLILREVFTRMVRQMDDKLIAEGMLVGANRSYEMDIYNTTFMETSKEPYLGP